jgi:hypothetical protein
LVAGQYKKGCRLEANPKIETKTEKKFEIKEHQKNGVTNVVNQCSLERSNREPKRQIPRYPVPMPHPKHKRSPPVHNDVQIQIWNFTATPGPIHETLRLQSTPRGSSAKRSKEMVPTRLPNPSDTQQPENDYKTTFNSAPSHTTQLKHNNEQEIQNGNR